MRIQFLWLSDIFSIVNGWRHDVYYIVVEESYIHLNQMVVIGLFVWYLLNDLLIDKNYLVLKKNEVRSKDGLVQGTVLPEKFC